MSDEFDDFLARTLGPAGRDPDRAFVARVQSQIRLGEQLRAERRNMLSALSIQVIGIATVAAAIFWLLQSPQIASIAAESPAILLTALLAAFSFVVLLFSSAPSHKRSWPSISSLRSLS